MNKDERIEDLSAKLSDAAEIAERFLLIGEERGWFNWVGDIETGGNASSIETDLKKLAKQKQKGWYSYLLNMVRALQKESV